MQKRIFVFPLPLVVLSVAGYAACEVGRQRERRVMGALEGFPSSGMWDLVFSGHDDFSVRGAKQTPA
jgi:hypothetical protein